jgi:hypothetical protein
VGFQFQDVPPDEFARNEADIELSAPWPQPDLTTAAADTHKVMALVRLHNHPLGVVALDVSKGPHSATVLAALRTRTEGFAGAADVGCVTGPILPAKLTTHAQLVLERRGSRDDGFEQRTDDTDLNRPGEPLFAFAAGRYGAATNLAVDTALLRRLGGIDHTTETGTFTRGGRDLSGFSRIILEHRLVYQPAAIVWSSTSL